MHRRTLIAIPALIALVLAASPAGAGELPPGGTFVDDNGDVHEGYIEAIAAADVTKGCNPPDNDRYCPTDAVRRGEMAAFLARALALPPAIEDHFSDDGDSAFEDAINRLADAGITKGCNPPDNDEYCPDNRVSRAQMASFIVRAFGYLDDGGGDRFVDDDGIVYEHDIDRLATAGVTLGCNPPDNDRYCPDEYVLRDQMASFLGRALGLTPMVPPPPPPPPPDPEVFAIGDSVMFGVACSPPEDPPRTCYGGSWNLEQRIDKLTSNAATSRSYGAGDDILAAWLAGHDPDVVIIALGTNGAPSKAQFDAVMDVAGATRRVLFVNVRQNNTANETATNSRLASWVPGYPNAELVDWFTVSAPLNLDAVDVNYGAHLWSTAVRQAYVTMIQDAIAGG